MIDNWQIQACSCRQIVITPFLVCRIAYLAFRGQNTVVRKIAYLASNQGDVLDCTVCWFCDPCMQAYAAVINLVVETNCEVIVGL